MREFTIRPDTLMARDSVLVDLNRQMDAALARQDAAQRALDAAWDRVVAPEPPEALFYQPGDDDLGVLQPTHFRDGLAWYGDEVDLVAKSTPRGAYERPDGSTGFRPDPKGAARVAEIVAAHRAWKAARAAALDAAGFTEADTTLSAAGEEERNLLAKMTTAPALTLAGVLVKVRSIGRCFGGIEGLDAEIGELPDGTAEALALAVVRDLLRMSTTPAAPAAPSA